MAQLQLTRGTISGAVTDQSGAAVPGAAITVKNVDTGVTRVLETGAVGKYEAPSLPPGNYEVRASLAGFQTTIRSGITLTVGRTAAVDLVLQVGEVAQVVTVTGEVTFVETNTATVSQRVDEQQVVDLPLNNRDLTQLIFLQPGVIRIPKGEFGFRSGMGDVFSVAGGRGSQNMYLLDGVSNSDFTGNAQGASTAYIGAETIKEFQIITNNYSAEYPSLPGAIISAVTKSGSNSLHGSLFEFLRNDKFDAFKWEDKARVGDQTPVKPEFKRNQFGGSLGGPIIRDRTFFFASYEGLRERKGLAGVARVPTVEAHQGILPGDDPDDPTGIAPEVAPYLALYPIPGQKFAAGRDFGDGTMELFGTRRTPVNDDFVAAKIDHQFASEKAGYLTGTYNFDDSDLTPIDVLGELNSADANTNRKNVLSLGHTSILSPTTLNEFNFGYTSVVIVGRIVTDGGRDWSDLLFVPGVQHMGALRVGSLDDIGFGQPGREYTQKSFTFKDGLSLTRGNHSLRMGAELSRFSQNIFFCAALCNGRYRFDDLEAFLKAEPRRFEARRPESLEPVIDMKQLYFGSYFQDNYSVLDSLTLNLGLRHEFVTVPKEVNGRSAALVHLMDPQTTVGPWYTNDSLKSFSPRIGFAWAPGSRKTSLRGGFGIFYDHDMMFELRTVTTGITPLAVEGRIDARNGIIRRVEPDVRLDFPNAFTTQQDFLGEQTNLEALQYDQDAARIYRWNLNLQRELGADWVLSAGYTGARATHLWISVEPNMNKWVGWPENPTGLKVWPDPEGPDFQGLIKPQFGEIRYQPSNGNSYHHGLELGAKKRLSRGLQLQMSYTFAKTLDQGADATGGELTQSERSMYFWDMDFLLGLSTQNIKNSFVANFSYEPLLGAGLTGVGGALAKGWQLNGILSLTSGSPLALYAETNDQEDWLGTNKALRPDLIPGGDNNPVLGSPDLYFDTSQFALSPLGQFGNLARNTLILPGSAVFDLSLFKNINVTEESRVQFRVEVFNLFNRPNFGVPEQDVWRSNGRRDANAGRINNTRTSARQIQFALKYIF
ncbi:MAG: TonB-dependent receptor [Acidobacteria bacterium]|nr:TonB-dependent receptor [Acidobacteriota bacterium]